MPKSKKKYASKNTLALLFIALPGITYLIINNYIPIVGTFIAFKKFSYAKGIWGSPWCGLNNFKFLFLTDDAWVITRNTLLYNLAFIVIGTVVSVIFAILLHELGELLRGKFFQSVLLFPHLLSWVVTAYLVYALLGSTTGFVNNTILNALGKKGVDWYTAKTAWPFILVIVYLWKNAGYNAIVYMAGIAGIDKEIYEAAKIDGANGWKTFWKITVPLLKPTIIMTFIMSINGTLQLFDESVNLTKGGPANSTITMSHYIYNTCFINVPNFGYAAAMSFIIFIMVAVLAFINLKVGDTRD